jgi:predicted ArsR family transcriptional regulator
VPKTAVTLTKLEQNKQKVEKALRKRTPKTIHDLAAELRIPRQALARPLQQLVTEGKAVREDVSSRVHVYTKP